MRCPLRARLFAILLALAIGTALVTADDHIVEFDRHVDFSRFKAFVMHEGRTGGARPDIDHALVLKNLAGDIRAQLTARGLKEERDRADLVVDFSFDTVAYSIGAGGRAWPIGANGTGQGGAAGSQDPLSFIEGTRVLDLRQAQPDLLIWRGVWRNDEDTAARISDHRGQVYILYR